MTTFQVAFLYTRDGETVYHDYLIWVLGQTVRAFIFLLIGNGVIYGAFNVYRDHCKSEDSGLQPGKDSYFCNTDIVIIQIRLECKFQRQNCLRKDGWLTFFKDSGVPGFVALSWGVKLLSLYLNK